MSWEVKLRVQGRVVFEGQVSKFMKRLQENFAKGSIRSGLNEYKNEFNVLRDLSTSNLPVNRESQQPQHHQQQNEQDAEVDPVDDTRTGEQNMKAHANKPEPSHQVKKPDYNKYMKNIVRAFNAKQQLKHLLRKKLMKTKADKLAYRTKRNQTYFLKHLLNDLKEIFNDQS